MSDGPRSRLPCGGCKGERGRGREWARKRPCAWKERVEVAQGRLLSFGDRRRPLSGRSRLDRLCGFAIVGFQRSTMRRVIGVSYEIARKKSLFGAFISGMGHALDLGGTLGAKVHLDDHPFATDARALAQDWQVVGKDLWSAMSSLEMVDPSFHGR